MVSVLAAVVIAGQCTIRYVVVPDRHEFPHGISLKSDERVELVQSAEIMRRDGYPDLDKIKALLCK